MIEFIWYYSQSVDELSRFTRGNTHSIRDATNTVEGVMGMVGTSSGFVKGGARKIPRLISAAFKKETWTDLFASFKRFSTKKSEGGLFGGNKKNIANKTDNIPDRTPTKVLKNVDEPKVSSKPSTTKKPADVETKAPTKQPHVDTDIPATKNIPEAKASELKKVDADVEKPKSKQVADGEKPPKSEILDDNSNLKDKELDNFKKYEDDVDASTKKKAKEDGDAEAGKGKDRDSKAKAIAMAKIIIEANDRIDTPIPGLLAELTPLKAMKGVKNFKAESRGNGKFEIYLIASKIKLDDYDIDSYFSEFKKIEHNVGLPIEFGGDLMKRDGVDLYVLGRTKGTKISGKSGSHAGTLNFKDIDGVEILHKPIPERIKTRFPDSLSDQTQAYWNEINGPWLDKAIKSGADIRFIQDPRLISNQVHIVTPIQKINNPKLFGKIKEHKTYLNFEYRYLLKRGYVLNENGLMTKIKK